MPHTSPKLLPDKYYLDYFEYLLQFVEKQYGGILNEKEWQFIRAFRSLSEEGRCLFVRLLNRSGRFFRTQKLTYQEISDLSQTLDELCREGFIAHFCDDHEPEATEVLDLFNKPELLAWLPLLELKPAGLSKLKKNELLLYLLENVPFSSLHDLLHTQEPVIRQAHQEEVDMLKFLFFGDLYGDMTDFVVRDVWDLRYESYDEGKFTPQFVSRKAAEDKYLLSKTYQQFKQLRETQPAADIYDWFINGIAAQSGWEATAQPVFDKLALRLGTLLEKNGLPELALRSYQYTVQPPSRERQARLLHKLKQLPEALAMCEQIQVNPKNADEKYFAIDFARRLENEIAKQASRKGTGKALRKSTTELLKSSNAVRVSATFKYQVEQGVIHYLSERSQQAVHTENHLWCSFFGLLCWDLIFDEDQQAIHHPLQRAPSDLYTPHFLDKRREQLEERLQVLHDRAAFMQLMQRTFTEKYGMGNPMVGWHESLLDLVLICYEKVKPEPLRKVMLEMATNLRENTRGFPDLFAWSDTDYCFIEVKSPNDHLSAQQLYWLQFFGENGIQAQVLRVEWEESEGNLKTEQTEEN
jgi:hypothetical protein